MATLDRKINFINGTCNNYGSVYNYFKEPKDYSYIVGFDFGDGECTFTVLKKETYISPKTGGTKITWEEFPVVVPDGNRVPTVIAYRDNGSCLIGSKAIESNLPIMLQFKQLPGIGLFNGKPQGSDKTYSDIMSDFIKELWRTFCNNVANKPIKDDLASTLVVVGFPAGGKWITSINRYRDFLRQCLDCDVVTVTEPTAAIFGFIYDKFPSRNFIDPGVNGKIFFSDGICVYEPGSSTLDFSYIVPGKRIVTDSINVAGRDIDRAMLEYVKNQNNIVRGINYTPDQERKLINELKTKKEFFYDNYAKNPEFEFSDKLDFVTVDINGNKVVKTVDITLNREFFDNVLAQGIRMNSAIQRNGILGKVIAGVQPMIKWETEVNNFIIKNKGIIGVGNKCSKVVISGGTGKVAQFQEYVKSAFNQTGVDVCISKDPIMSVSRGLAYIKALEITAGKSIDDFISKMDENKNKSVEAIKKEEYNRFAEIVSAKLSKAIVDAFELACVEFLSTNEDTIGPEMFGQLIDEKLNQIYIKENINQDYLAEELWKIFEGADKELVASANDLAKEVYRYYTGSYQIVKLKDTEPNFYGFNVADKAKLSKITAKMLKDKSYADVAFNGSGLNHIAFNLFQNIFKRKKLMKKCNELQNKEKREMLTGKVNQKIKKEIIKNSKIEELFSEYIKIQAEIYFGKALLVVCDE